MKKFKEFIGKLIGDLITGIIILGIAFGALFLAIVLPIIMYCLGHIYFAGAWVVLELAILIGYLSDK